MTIPAWVDDEIWNWSRMHWEGEYPGPRRIGEAARTCAFPYQEVEADDQSSIPVNHERAKAVEAIYQTLCHDEKRVIHAEYTRIKEYGNLPDHIRGEKASRNIGISPLYYKLALRDFKVKVWEAFR